MMVAMAKERDTRQHLMTAAEGSEPVRFRRSLDRLRLYGCVVGVSPKWVLLHNLEGGLFLSTSPSG
jgi:hypothetical protein